MKLSEMLEEIENEIYGWPSKLSVREKAKRILSTILTNGMQPPITLQKYSKTWGFTWDLEDDK